MKIAITGHSAGIGQALSNIYQNQGHEIIGLSRRIGYNIRNLSKILHMIEPCDVLINNAQTGFAQTELLFAIFEKWQHDQSKLIINISTMMTSSPYSTIPELGMDLYRIQKLALEEAHRQLYFKNGPRMILVKPGSVATQPDQNFPEYADVNEWAKTLVELLDTVKPNLKITEISLGPNYYES